jgi:hypothetical protein
MVALDLEKFERENINGDALLQLTKEDLYQKLGVTIGRGSRLYATIKVLQMQLQQVCYTLCVCGCVKDMFRCQ